MKIASAAPVGRIIGALLPLMLACASAPPAPPQASEAPHRHPTEDLPLDPHAPDGQTVEVVVAMIPTACCPACQELRVHVRNQAKQPVVIDWEYSRLFFNGEQVELNVVDEDRFLAVAAQQSLSVKLRPPSHAAWVSEGEFRAGRYTLDVLLVQKDDALSVGLRPTASRAVVDVVSRPAHLRSPTEEAVCELLRQTPRYRMGGGRPESWPDMP